MDLHGPVRRLAAQPVGPVVAHRDPVRDRERPVGVHLPRGLLHQRPEHLALRLELDQGELDPLVDRERPAERPALLRIRDRLVDAVLGGSEAGGGLSDPVLVEEVLGDLQSATLLSEDGAVGHAHVGERHAAVVGRHVEGPEVLLYDQSVGVHGGQERCDAMAVPGLAGGPGQDHVAVRPVYAGVPRLLAVDHPSVPVAHGAGLHVGGVRSVLRLGDPEGETTSPLQQVWHPFGLLFVAPVLQHQQQSHVVADDRVLVLEVVVQPEAPGGEVLPDDGHAQVGAVPAAQFL